MSRLSNGILIVFPIMVFLLVLASMEDRKDGIVVVGWGGSTQNAISAAMIDSFSRETGLAVREDSYDGSYSLLESKAESSKGNWDVVEVETTVLNQAASRDLVREIPNLDSVSGVKESRKSKYGAGLFEWWTVLSWNKTRIPEGVEEPSTWDDFWDTRKYPGPRGIRKSPRAALEIALLADGVPADSLYPLDVERALNKLDLIRDEIRWWETGGEQQARLLSEYTMSTAWSGRVWVLIQDGEPVDMTLNGGIADVDWWVIPKNTSDYATAVEFVRHALRADVQADFSNLTGYGPVNNDAYPMLDERIRTYIDPRFLEEPTTDFDARWWAENEAEVLNRWRNWLL